MPASLLPSHHINIPSSSSGGGGGPLTGGRRVSNTSRKLRSRRGWIVLVCCALLVLGYQGLSRGGGAAGDDDHAAEVLQRQRQAAGAAGGSSTGGIMSPRQEGRAQAALARLLPFGLGRGGNVNDDDGDADRRAGASSGIHLLTEDEDELIAEDDRYYDSLPEGAEHHSTNKSSYSPSSVTGADEDDEDEDEDENSGAGGAAATAALPQFHSLIPLDDRLGSDADPALSEQARSRLIGVEALTRHSAIRALSHYLYEGGELPRRWLDTDVDAVHGQTPLDKVKERVWKHAGGDGMEDQLFEVIQAGDQDLGEDTFEEGWKAFADERLKVVIFSKSYCPFSRKAKAIFQKYEIHPRPFIVELDQREDGPVIQTLLHSLTGRRTVPNILVNFAPLGGADEVTLLEAEGSLRKRLVEAGLTVDTW